MERVRVDNQNGVEAGVMPIGEAGGAWDYSDDAMMPLMPGPA